MPVFPEISFLFLSSAELACSGSSLKLYGRKCFHSNRAGTGACPFDIPAVRIRRPGSETMGLKVKTLMHSSVHFDFLQARLS